MSLRGKRIAEITRADIRNLVVSRVAEDLFQEFKREILHPAKPADKLNEEKGDLVADFVAFANAQGGHLIVGIDQDEAGRAHELVTMPGDSARSLGSSLRDLAISHIRPPIALLEVQPVQLDGAGKEWVVIAAIPEGQDKPHMSTYNDGSRFVIRVGDRKRTMTYEEISRLFISGPRDQMLSRLLLDISEIKAMVTALAPKPGT